MAAIILAIAFLLFAVRDYLQFRYYAAAGYVVLAVLVPLFYPAYAKGVTKRRFRKYVQENYNHRFEKDGSLEITSQYLHAISAGEDVRIETTNVEMMYETEHYFFIKTMSGAAFMIPKMQVDVPAVQTELQAIAAQQGKEYVAMPGWKW